MLGSVAEGESKYIYPQPAFAIYPKACKFCLLPEKLQITGQRVNSVNDLLKKVYLLFKKQAIFWYYILRFLWRLSELTLVLTGNRYSS